MLDEQEFALMSDAYRIGAGKVKRVRALTGLPLAEVDQEAAYREMAARFYEITGVSLLDPQEMLRHRLSRLGPPCAKCGKELRTPLAKRCVECGHQCG